MQENTSGGVRGDDCSIRSLLDLVARENRMEPEPPVPLQVALRNVQQITV